jgi:hypothetical protein
MVEVLGFHTSRIPRKTPRRRKRLKKVLNLAFAIIVYLFVFGLWYAKRVRYRPLKPTWLEVVIGVIVTIMGFFGLVWSFYDTKIAYGPFMIQKLPSGLLEFCLFVLL